MSRKQNNLIIISFYRFIDIEEKSIKKKLLDNLLRNKIIRGTILLSNEGINGSIAGEKNEVLEALKFLKKLVKIRKLHIKTNNIDFLPFNKMKVRLKKEIVSLGIGNINVNKLTGGFIHPSKWNKMVSNKDVKIVDVRNPYEIKIGKFSNSLNPQTENFKQFPEQFRKLNIDKNQKIAMYCTGGIRCEKASAYLNKEGYKNIFQLEGGILNYLDYYKRKQNINKWNGECFVFDDRVTVKKNLKKGSYDQCYGCRSPITEKDKKSKSFVKGVCCPHCYGTRSFIQQQNSRNRQGQIEQAEKNNINNPFKRIYR